MRNNISLSIFIIFTILLAACSSPAAIVPATIGDPEEGEALFNNPTRGRCAECHDQNGEDIPTGPALIGIGAEAGKRVKVCQPLSTLSNQCWNPLRISSKGTRIG